MTWARSQGIKEQGCEPGPPTLGSYAFLLVLLNPERMTGDLLPEVCLKEVGARHLQMKADLGQEDIHLHSPTDSHHLITLVGS